MRSARTHVHTPKTTHAHALVVQEEGDPLAMDPLEMMDDEQVEDEVDEQTAQEEEDSSLFDMGSGMSRSDVKQVCCVCVCVCVCVTLEHIDVC